MMAPIETIQLAAADDGICDQAFVNRCFDAPGWSDCCETCTGGDADSKCDWSYNITHCYECDSIGGSYVMELRDTNCMESCTFLGQGSNNRSDYCKGGAVYDFVQSCPAAKASLQEATDLNKWCEDDTFGKVEINCHWSYVTSSVSGKEEINGSFPFDEKDSTCLRACEDLGKSTNRRLDYCAGSVMWDRVQTCKTAEINVPGEWCQIQEGKSLSELVLKNGGSFGDDLRLTLTWNQCDDVDLHLEEPPAAEGKAPEEIYYGHKRSTNLGHLDIDQRQCKYNDEALPLVENINYPDPVKIAEGTYKAKIVYYRRGAKVTGDTLWTLQIANDHHISIHKGSFQTQKQEWTFEFTYPWKDGDPALLVALPNQNVTTEVTEGHSSVIRAKKATQLRTVQPRNDYQASSSIQELPKPMELASAGWNHSECENAFNAECWNKGRFVDKHHPELSCCRDCAKVWVNDTCHWGWSSELHNAVHGAFDVNDVLCYKACQAIDVVWSFFDFCSADVQRAVKLCPNAMESIQAAQTAGGWDQDCLNNTALLGAGHEDEPLR